MHKSISKKVGIVFMIVSLLSLIGCGSLDQRQAKQIEKKLSEKYDGEIFEVYALGNRFGTLTNDTVKAYVKAMNTGVVFEIQMDRQGEIVADNYIGRIISDKIGKLLVKHLKDEGFTSCSLLFSFGGNRHVKLDRNMSPSEYVLKRDPEYISGYLVVKENENLSGKSFLNAFQKTYEELHKVPIQTNVWIFPEENFDQIINEFSNLPEVSNSWFKDKNPSNYFLFSITKDGPNIDVNEIKKQLQGGD